MQEWQAATSTISTKTSAIPASAWRTPLTRHLRLGDYLDGDSGGNSNNNNGGNKDLLDGEYEEGYTHPLHVAASQNILKLGSLLLSGATGAPAADPNARDRSGRTALHWAAMTDRAGFLLLLLKSGAAIDAIDSQGRTPLLSSAAFGATQAVHLLLRWGADASRASRGGFTPLHGAASGGHAEVADALVEAGADVHRRTDMGANPRHLAERQGHAGVVRLLSVAAAASRSRGSSLSSAAAAAVGGYGCLWGGGDGGVGVGGVAYEDEREEGVFAQHRFDRQSLLQRPLFR